MSHHRDWAVENHSPMDCHRSQGHLRSSCPLLLFSRWKQPWREEGTPNKSTVAGRTLSGPPGRPGRILGVMNSPHQTARHMICRGQGASLDFFMNRTPGVFL